MSAKYSPTGDNNRSVQHAFRSRKWMVDSQNGSGDHTATLKELEAILEEYGTFSYARKVSKETTEGWIKCGNTRAYYQNC